MAAKKRISSAELMKLVKEAHKLDPMKPIPKNVAKRMDATIARLAAAEKAAQSKPRGGMRGGAGGIGGGLLPKQTR
jgi:hypothetical protein